MTDHDLDNWAAEELIDLVDAPYAYSPPDSFITKEVRAYLTKNGAFFCYVKDWHPSTDLNQTFQVVEKMRGMGWLFKLVQWKDCYTAWFERPGRHEWQMGDTPALAILKAAREAINDSREHSRE